MKVYRLVDELSLDWIFKCINRGKINKRKEDVIGWEQGRS